MAAHGRAARAGEAASGQPAGAAPGGVAIVGIGCRFPGGITTAGEFWDFLVAGGDAVTEAPPGRFDPQALDGGAGASGIASARWGGFLDGIEAFDAEFFGISPREARRMDPQQRLLLEVVWEALEDGGLSPDGLAGTDTGVFVGISGHDYADLQSQPASRALIDAHVSVGGANSIAANRISYVLDLHGPSVSVDTACSSALTAVHLACAGLAAGHCGVAIAAAANALLTAEPTIANARAGMLSRSGRCRPFDAEADGYVRSEGVAALVLKPLDRALADGDPVHAVIRGTGVNQDGRTPALSVPNPAAQEALLRQVLREAGVLPVEVGYVEAHGTGTPVGDPREAAAIGAVMADRPVDAGPCLVGSVKGNLGHLESAAGMAGLVKAALAVRHRLVPPTIHHTQPNPAIDFQRLRVPTSPEPWPGAAGAPAVAAVNSFGFGGANAHALVQEPPAARPASADAARPHLVTLSARSAQALQDLARGWVDRLGDGDAPLADLAFTAAARRAHHEHRLAVVGGTRQEVAADLSAFAAGSEHTATVARARSDEPRVAFVFSGMGPQWWGMGRDLLRDEPVFAETIHECDRLLRPLAGWSLVEELLAGEGASRVAEPFLAHVANLGLQVALAALWRSWGIVPDAVVGHSSGEMGAACVAGVLPLPDAVRLAFHRGRLQQRAAGTGGMLAAGITAQDAADLLEGRERRVSLAAVNSPASVTFAGDLGALEEIAGTLEARGCFRRMLPVTVPYHGPQMGALRAEFLEAVDGLAPHPPAVPIVSTVTGDWPAERPFDAAYWWANVQQPVRFGAAVDRLAADGCEVFVELAPHPVLGPVLLECLRDRGRDGAVVASLRRGEPDRAVMLRGLAALHVRGRRVAWDGVFRDGGRCVPLPRYPWQHQRHWMPEPPRGAPAGSDTGHPLLGRRLHAAHPTWQADLADPRLDYLDGHLVQGSAAFPGAAHVEIAIAAAQAWRGEGPVALEDVVFERVLGLAQRDALTLQTLMQPRSGAVEIHSAERADADGWTLRARARVAARTPSRPNLIDVAAVRERCAEDVDVDGFYRTLRDRHGLGYGGAFRSVTELLTGDGEAVGAVALPDETRSDTYAVHPALLDAAFQVLGAAAWAGSDAQADDMLLPVAIARVTFHRPPGRSAVSQARITRHDRDVVEGDVVLTDGGGKVTLACSGLRLQRLGDATGGSIGDWYYEPRWEPAPRRGAAIPPASEVAAMIAPLLGERTVEQRLEEYYTSVEPALDALTLRFVREALATLGYDPGRDAAVPAGTLADRLGVVERQRRFFQRLLVLERSSAPAAGVRDDVDEAYPSYRSAFSLVRESGRRLVDTLRGAQDAREWLVAGEWFDAWVDLYAVSPMFLVYVEVVAEAVATAQAARPSARTRILEVGAGTGSATAPALDRLAKGSFEYLFTDVSGFFLRAARERFARRPELAFDVLDVEQPPEDLGPFDVIVAADVVHATADVRATLRNLRGLLAPGGLLVLQEAVRRCAWLDLVVGQLEGWWRATDRDLRPDHPLLGVGAWVRVLQDSGFAEATAVTDDVERAGGDPSHAVLLATAPVAVPAPGRGRRWLVLTDRRGVGPEVTATLRARGDDCTLVWPGAGYRRFGGDGIQLRPASSEDWVRLLAEIDGVDGVIGLWALDAPAAPSGSVELMAFQEASCGWVVALLEALVRSGRALPDDVWLVTAGAAATDEVDVVGPAGVAQAPLWGLGRVLRTERGSGRCRLVDLGAGCGAQDVEALLAEVDLPEADREDEVALRGGRRLAQRLRPASPGPAAVERVTVDPDRTAFRLVVGRPGALETLALREHSVAEPGPGEVTVRVVAAALNFRDVLVALGVGFAAGGQDPATAPLGWECAGVVVACGPGVREVAVGDEVVAIAAGAIASQATTLAARTAPKPEALSFEDAATLPVAFLTAHWALERLARLAAGERVLVHAASGGVGLAAVQLARRAGAEVYATAGTDAKRAFLRSLGVEYVADSRTLDFADEVLDWTGGEGVDVVLNSLSGEAIDRGLEVLRAGGRFVEIAKRDVYEGGRLPLAPFRRNLSYFALDLQPLYSERPVVIGQLLRWIVEEVDAGRLQPLPYHAFDLAEGEQAFRLMAQARHIGKVVLTAGEPRYEVVPEGTANLARRDAAYVVTGGLGGFGLAVARWLVDQGAGHVVLVSRSGAPRAEDAAAFDALKASPAHVEVLRGDVADAQETARVLDHVRRSVAPLRGVVHAAMVLDDALLGRLSYDRFEAVLAPKLGGAWNLHTLTGEDDLDFFVLFSSVSALIGQPAQASYAAANESLGALAQHRRACGKPALTVDWGAITEAGYVARHPELAERMQRQGLMGIAPEDACAALGELLRAGVVRMGVSSVDWSARAAQMGQQAEASTAATTQPAGDRPEQAAHDLRSRLATTPARDRVTEVERYLVAVTARVLETAPDRVDVERRLPDMGIDSLMAVELRTALRAELGVEVPIVDLLEQLSVRRLAETVAERLERHAAAS